MSTDPADHAGVAPRDGPRIALVLGAGGPVGHAFHAGVLAALSDVGWDARDAAVVVGTSIGAVTAGVLAAGLAPEDLFAHATYAELSGSGAEMVARAWRDPTWRIDLSRRTRSGPPIAPGLTPRLLGGGRRLRPGLILASLAPAGTVSTAPIVKGFARLAPGPWPPALRIAAYDLDGADRVVFGAPSAPSVPLGVAVAASCAVPSYFAPVEVDGHRLVDGGVFSPANTDVVVAEMAADPAARRYDAVIASVPMGIGGWPNRGGVDLPGRWANQRAAQRGLRPLAQAGVPVVTFAPGAAELEVMHYDAFDLTHLAQVARRARAAARMRLRDDPTLGPIVALLGRQGGKRRPDAAQADAGRGDGTGTGGASPT